VRVQNHRAVGRGGDLALALPRALRHVRRRPVLRPRPPRPPLQLPRRHRPRRRARRLLLLWRRRHGAGRPQARPLRRRRPRRRPRHAAGPHRAGPRPGLRARRPPLRPAGLLAPGFSSHRRRLQPKGHQGLRGRRLRGGPPFRRPRHGVVADEASGGARRRFL
ncbi:MAG: hypothetical protein AVDCRST_MAG12-601, partial [uncultured Rubrobacteraceae bacterium]